MATGISVQGIKLGYKTTESGSTYSYFDQLTQIPALKSAPNMITYNKFSSNRELQAAGLIKAESTVFQFVSEVTVDSTNNTVTDADYTAALALEGNETWFKVDLPNGESLTFSGIPYTSIPSATSGDNMFTWELNVAISSSIVSSLA